MHDSSVDIITDSIFLTLKNLFHLGIKFRRLASVFITNKIFGVNKKVRKVSYNLSLCNVPIKTAVGKIEHVFFSKSIFATCSKVGR